MSGPRGGREEPRALLGGERVRRRAARRRRRRSPGWTACMTAQRVQVGRERLARRRLGLGASARSRSNSIEDVLEDRADERFLGREAAVQRALADTGAARDLLHAHVQPRLGEGGARGIQDARAVAGGVGPQWADMGLHRNDPISGEAIVLGLHRCVRSVRPAVAFARPMAVVAQTDERPWLDELNDEQRAAATHRRRAAADPRRRRDGQDDDAVRARGVAGGRGRAVGADPAADVHAAGVAGDAPAGARAWCPRRRGCWAARSTRWRTGWCARHAAALGPAGRVRGARRGRRGRRARPAARGARATRSAATRFPKKGTLLDIYSRTVNAQQPLSGVVEEHFPWVSEHREAISALFRAYTARKRELGRARPRRPAAVLARAGARRGDRAAAGRGVRPRADRRVPGRQRAAGRPRARARRRSAADVTAVGDDFQAIYGFRSASAAHILDFPEHFPGTRVVTLERNYRSDAARAGRRERARRAGDPRVPEASARRPRGRRAPARGVLPRRGRAGGGGLRPRCSRRASRAWSCARRPCWRARRTTPTCSSSSSPAGGSRSSSTAACATSRPRTSRTSSRCCAWPTTAPTTSPGSACCSSSRASARRARAGRSRRWRGRRDVGARRPPRDAMRRLGEREPRATARARRRSCGARTGRRGPARGGAGPAARRAEARELVPSGARERDAVIAALRAARDEPRARARAPRACATCSRRWSGALPRRRAAGRRTSTSSSPPPTRRRDPRHFVAELVLDPPQLERRPRAAAAPGRGLPDALDDPLGQGPGVGQRARARGLRRQLPRLHVGRHERADRRGAPAAVRRDDPRAPHAHALRAGPLPPPPARPRRRARLRQAVALPTPEVLACCDVTRLPGRPAEPARRPDRHRARA